MSDKNSMIFYYDWLNLFDELSNAEVGELVLAAVRYDQLGEDTPFEDRGLRVAFKALKNSIDISNDKYQEICEKRRLAAERRWKEANANESKSMQMHPNANFASYTDTDTVTDTDIDTETVTETESGGGEPPQPPLSDQDVRRIAKAWNEQDCTQHISGLTENRRKKILECGDINVFIDTINSLDRQQYLVNQAKAGKAVTFDWFVQPDNYRKVLEGNYKETYGGGSYGLARDW